MEKHLTKEELQRMGLILELDKKGNMCYAELQIVGYDNIHFYKEPTPEEIYNEIANVVATVVEARLKAKFAAKFFED